MSSWDIWELINKHLDSMIKLLYVYLYLWPIPMSKPPEVEALVTALRGLMSTTPMKMVCICNVHILSILWPCICSVIISISSVPLSFCCRHKTKICTIDRQLYDDKTEPVDPSYVPSEWDTLRSETEPWKYLLKYFALGKLYVVVWGKLIMIVCEHVSEFHIALPFLSF